jgi:hypothetical protein
MRSFARFADARFFGCLMLTLVVVLVGGCGGRKTGNVSGKVRLDGQPVPGGFVNFFPESGANTGAKASPIGADGSYSVTGVPVGPAKISVQGVYGSTQLPNMKGPNGMDMPRSDRKTVYVPPRYSTVEQSGLTWDVKPGSEEHDIELKGP